MTRRPITDPIDGALRIGTIEFPDGTRSIGIQFASMPKPFLTNPHNARLLASHIIEQANKLDDEHPDA